MSLMFCKDAPGVVASSLVVVLVCPPRCKPNGVVVAIVPGQRHPHKAVRVGESVCRDVVRCEEE